MKEIDFLPDWYKNGRRRRMSYQTQYAVILCALLAMAGWSFFTARSVSNVQAQVDLNQVPQADVNEYKEIESKITGLKAKAELLDKLDSKINVADVLAELSYLVNPSIVLTSVKFEAHSLESDQPGQSNSQAAVRVARSSNSAGTMQGKVCFKVVVQGMAYEAGDVARLICSMEDSVYFSQVIPGFSRSKQLKEKQVCEFEITSMLANYEEIK